MFWIMGNQKYDQLRQMEGMEGLADLNAVPETIECIKKMFKGFGATD